MTEQKPPTILFLALYGSEIPWASGGTIAKATRAGGEAHALVFLQGDDDPPDAAGQDRHACDILGVKTLRHLKIPYLGVQADRQTILEAVRTIRETRPDVIITQDPVHSVADHDPDRRAFTNVVQEALSVCYRNLAIEECGGLEPHGWKSLYYWWPETPNVLIDISETFDDVPEFNSGTSYGSLEVAVGAHWRLFQTKARSPPPVFSAQLRRNQG